MPRCFEMSCTWIRFGRRDITSFPLRGVLGDVKKERCKPLKRFVDWLECRSPGSQCRMRFSPAPSSLSHHTCHWLSSYSECMDVQDHGSWALSALWIFYLPTTVTRKPVAKLMRIQMDHFTWEICCLEGYTEDLGGFMREEMHVHELSKST